MLYVLLNLGKKGKKLKELLYVLQIKKKLG